MSRFKRILTALNSDDQNTSIARSENDRQCFLRGQFGKDCSMPEHKFMIHENGTSVAPTQKTALVATPLFGADARKAEQQEKQEKTRRIMSNEKERKKTDPPGVQCARKCANAPMCMFRCMDKVMAKKKGVQQP